MKPRCSQALLTVALLVTFVGTGRAQSLLVDFQAANYTGGSTWTDTEGAVATYAGSSAAVANGTSVTTNGGFTFNTGSVSGLDGLTSYTVAVEFTPTSITPENPSYPFASSAFAGNGVFGGDISGFGQGDIGLSLSSYNNGMVAGGGDQSGGDDTIYNASVANGGTFALNTPTAAVLVVQANTAAPGDPANGSLSLYVNGVLAAQETGLTPQPFGYIGGRFSGSIEPYDFGVGTMTGAYGGGFNGTLAQELIYNGVFSSGDAETLSVDLVPEPSAWAMTLAGGAFLVALNWRRRLSSLR